jgi:hypothetical protein
MYQIEDTVTVLIIKSINRDQIKQVFRRQTEKNRTTNTQLSFCQILIDITIPAAFSKNREQLSH